MKDMKNLFRSIAVISAALCALPALASSASISKDLYFGMRGSPEVESLQQFLKDGGFYAGPVTGNFFSLTREAVKKLQRAHMIEPAAGYVGAKTRALIVQLQGTASSNVPTSQLEMLIAQVQALQSQLAASQATPVASTTPAAMATSTTSNAYASTSAAALPNPFKSSLKMEVLFPSMTLSRYAGVTLTEFRFSAQEKIGITRLRFRNSSTLPDANLADLRLLDLNDRLITTGSDPVNGYFEFKTPYDRNKPDNGLLVSGAAYHITATIITPNATIKPKIKLDVLSASDISAFDYNDLSRIADLSDMAFPVEGPVISTF